VKISKVALRTLISEMMLQEDDTVVGRESDDVDDTTELVGGDRWGLDMDSAEMVELYHYIGDHFGNALLKTVNEDTYSLETNVITLRRYITALLRDDSAGGYYAEYGRPAGDDPTADPGGVRARLLDTVTDSLKDEMLFWMEDTMPSVPEIVGAWERATMDGPTIWSDIPVLTNMGYTSPGNDNPYVQIWGWIEAGWVPNIRPQTVDLERMEAEGAEGAEATSVPETEDFRTAMTVTEAESLADELVERFQPYYDDALVLAEKAESLFTGTVAHDPPCGSELEEFVNLIIEILNDPSRSGQSGLTFRMAAGLYADRVASPGTEPFDDAVIPSVKFLGVLGGLFVANIVFKKIPYFGPMYAGGLTRFGGTKVGGALFRNNWSKWALRGAAAGAFTGVLALADNETGMFTALTMADSNELKNNIGPDLESGVDCHKVVGKCDDYERCGKLKEALYTFWNTLQDDSHGGGSGEFRLALTNNDLRNVLYVNLPEDIGGQMVSQSEEQIPESVNHTSDLRDLISLLVNEGLYDDPRYANQNAANREDRSSRPTIDSDSDGRNNAVDSDTRDPDVWKLANHGSCKVENPPDECWVPTGEVECAEGQELSDDRRSCVDIPEATETETETETEPPTGTGTSRRTSSPSPRELNQTQEAMQTLQAQLGVDVQEVPPSDGHMNSDTRRAWQRWLDGLITLEYRQVQQLEVDGKTVSQQLESMKIDWSGAGRDAAQLLIPSYALPSNPVEAMADFHYVIQEDYRNNPRAQERTQDRIRVATSGGGGGGVYSGRDSSGSQRPLHYQPEEVVFATIRSAERAGGAVNPQSLPATPTTAELNRGDRGGWNSSIMPTLAAPDSSHPGASLYIRPGRSGTDDYRKVGPNMGVEILDAILIAAIASGRRGRGFTVAFNGRGLVLASDPLSRGSDWLQRGSALARTIRGIVRRYTNVGERDFNIIATAPDQSYTRAGDFSR